MKKKYALLRFLPALLMGILFMMVSPLNTIGQNLAADASVVQDAPEEMGAKTISLELFMQKFQRVYNVYFSYQAVSLKEIKVTDINIEGNRQQDPDQLLKKVLNPAGLTYEKVSNVYVIKQIPEPKLVLTKNEITAPVDFLVKGSVKDKNGALANVTVSEKGTTNATTTNADGRFSLNVASPNATLVFSYVGYKAVELKINGQSDVIVLLEAQVSELSNVVVTALGITRNKKSMAYSVGEVKAEDLVKAGNPNVLKSLDGKVSGVNFTNLSSDPTSSVLVNIRGTTAMPTKSNANVAISGQPLYVIDGIPVGAQTFTNKNGVDFGNILSQLNPEDIDNITILKGGSAGALYGADGGNGVVMITTKTGKGRKKGLGVSFNSSSVWDKPTDFIEEQMEYGQGERAFEWQYDNTDTWGPKLDGKFSGDYWDTKQQKWLNKSMTSSMENRMQAYLQTGNTLSNTIGVYGNYDKGSFRFSFGDMNNKGVMPNTKTDQKSISLNTDYRITDKVKLTVSSSYIHTLSPNKANSVGSNSVINNLLFNFPANLQPLSEMTNYWLTGYENIQQNGAIMKDNGLDVDTDNPWWSTYEKINRFGRDNFFGKVQLDWQLSKPLALVVRTGMESVKEEYEYRQSWGKTKMADKFKTGDGQYITGTNSMAIYNTDVILTYNKNFGKFSLNAFGGGNYQYTNNNSLEMNAAKLSTPALFTLNNAMPGQLFVSQSGWATSQTYSLYGSASVGYANQLFLDITGRNDWKGILPEEKINYFYPSASLSWVASETFKLPEIFNLVKGRLAWADVGNGLVKQRSVDTYSYDPSNWGAAKTVSINATLVDPNIKPMHSITQEAGLDIWMLQNLLKFDFTYFIKDQKDQIDNIPTVPGTGYPGMLTNIGDVRSKGYEMGLTINPVRTKDWNWTISGSFTHYKATITRLSDQFAPNGYVFADYDGKTRVKIAVGEEIGNIYEQNPILRVKEGKYAGMPLLDGAGGEFQTSGDEKDRGKLGNYNPDYIVGFNTTLRYKQFALNLVGSYRKGGKYVSVNQQYLESNGRVSTTLGSGPNNPWWMGGRDAEHGGLPWPAAGSSQYEAINTNNDGQRADWSDASYAKGVFVNPNFTGDKPTDADYIVNGADPNNTFYQFAYNSYGDVIWDFAATRTYSATNFKMKEISLAYTVPASLTSKYKLNNLTLSFIGRNLIQWNESGRHEDPESAFSGVGTGLGVLRATLPSIRSYGFKLSVEF
ncbi:SusC/RagA family TonB-linked outer membrane protein [Flavihumibacter profundi]|uniref:SusC/RagA family TonB-linked outer membrane protein n=1 Tax=Flavihumibacter profundi TaxID=2716883 RepID=UPI001CC7383D|nr:SusC/RagA family TonB-linked outer membrane protein [Flavihumibacter profundi]MBZ5856010.1 SusC/RagA family TonB-linked outer membrane protein [Flavihumibacter profundi]